MMELKSSESGQIQTDRGIVKEGKSADSPCSS